jgi:hypothetical protein
MHRQHFANVISIERDQIGDLFAFGLGQLEPIACFDFKTDVSRWGQGDSLTWAKNCGCTVHEDKDLSFARWLKLGSMPWQETQRKLTPLIAGERHDVGGALCYAFP